MAVVLQDGGLGHEQGLDPVDEAHPLTLQSKEIGKYYTLPNLMILNCQHHNTQINLKSFTIPSLNKHWLAKEMYSVHLSH